MFDKFKIERKHMSIAWATIFVGAVLFFIFRLSIYSEQILGITLQFIKNLFSVLSPVFYAFIISYILYRPMRFIERKISWLTKKTTKHEMPLSLGRILSILILLVLLIGASYLLFNLVIPPLFQNVQMLINSLPKFQTVINDFLQNITSTMSDEQIATLSTWLSNGFSTIATAILNIGTGVVTNITGFVLNTIATIILTFYFLKDKETIFRNLNKLGFVILPHKWLYQIKSFLHDLHIVFGNFIVGQLLDALFVGIASSGLLLIIGHPFALVIGLIAGVTNIIPYVGPIIGAALAFILGLFTSLNMGVLGFILLIAYQQIDGYFIQPKILGDSVGLSPVWIFLAILIGGSYFGAMGMIIAVPFAGLLGVFVKRRYASLKS